MLVECKFWDSSIPQDTVHSFHTVMTGAGANTGFIISKIGFQSGAYEAAQKNTNIHLLTWKGFQHKFGRQWYLY
jgi:predicted helicase